MPMKWRTITKKEAEDIFKKWDERPTVDCDPEFMRLRTDLLNELNKIRDKLAIVPEPDNRLGYEFDLQFGLVFIRCWWTDSPLHSVWRRMMGYGDICP